uniref:Potassium channel subfamily K member 18 n=1 Tax=Parastrongyloides trichosuri TaxID=131310 RepID=A0A0N4ZSX1_PARTI
MARTNHGLSINIEQKYNSFISDDDDKSNDNENSQETIHFKKSYSSNLIYKLLIRFKNFIFQLKLLFIIVLYSILGGMLFIYLEKDSDLASKQESYNYHLVARDMLFHDIKKIHIENREDREHRWKEAILEFESNINVSPPSLETSWTFSMAIFYAGTIYTTIGYGNIACSTSIGRVVSIIYAFIGIPIFLIILNNLNEFLLKKIKLISILFEDTVFYYSIKIGLLKLQGEKRIRRYQTIRKKKDFGGYLENELLEFSKLTDSKETRIDVESQENESITKTFVHDPPILTGVFVTLIWIFLSAGLFCLWEDWTYGSSAYFIFISLLTIGFGDMYPVNKPELFCWAFGAVIVGLSLVTVCISLCQEKVELLYKAILDKMLEDYIKALESGDPNALKDAMSSFGGKAKFIMPLISKSKGVKMMEDLKTNAKEKGIDLPPSMTSVNPETGRPNFVDTNKNELDNFIKKASVNAEKVVNESKVQKGPIKTVFFENLQIQTDDSLLKTLIEEKRNNFYNNRKNVNDVIIQTDNKRNVDCEMQTDVKQLTINCGVQPEVSYLTKQSHIENNKMGIYNCEKTLEEKKNDENIFINFMKDTASDPIFTTKHKNIGLQTKGKVTKSRRSQTRFTGIVKTNRNVKGQLTSDESDLEVDEDKIDNDGMTKKEKRHLKKILVEIRRGVNYEEENGNSKGKFILNSEEETVLLMKELENYRINKGIWNPITISKDVGNYNYELTSDYQGNTITENVHSPNNIKDQKIIDESSLHKESWMKTNNLEKVDLLQKSLQNFDNGKLSNILNETNDVDNKALLIEQQLLDSKQSNITALNNEKDKECTDDLKDAALANVILLNKNIENNGNSQLSSQNSKNESIIRRVSSKNGKYEEITVNIRLIKKFKKEENKFMTSSEKEYITKLTADGGLLLTDFSDSDGEIGDTKKNELRKLGDGFSSEDDNLSIEELFTNGWSQTEWKFEYKNKDIIYSDKECQFDKDIEKTSIFEKNCQTDVKYFNNIDIQTNILNILDNQCQTEKINFNDMDCQTYVESIDSSTQEPFRDPKLFDGIYTKDVGIETSYKCGNFTSQYNYTPPSKESYTQYICDNADFGHQYVYKVNTLSMETQAKIESVDFNSQYTYTPLTVSKESQVSCRKKETNTQTEIKFYEEQGVQFNVEKIDVETQVGFDDRIISSHTSLKNLSLREGIKQSVEDISKILVIENIEEDVSLKPKFTLFNNSVKLKETKTKPLTREEKKRMFSTHSSYQIDIDDEDINTEDFHSNIEAQQHDKKFAYMKFSKGAISKVYKDESFIQRTNIEICNIDQKTANKKGEKPDNVIDVGIQTGVLARVQHIYGDGKKDSGSNDPSNIASPEFQKVNLKKTHAIDDKGVYRSVDITPPTSPSAVTLRKHSSIKKDRPSKKYGEHLLKFNKETSVPNLIKSFSSQEDQDESNIKKKNEHTKKSKDL